MDESYRKYVNYHTALANAGARIVSNAILTKNAFESVMSSLSHDTRAVWLEKFRLGYEQTSHEQKDKIVLALCGLARSEKKAA